MRLMPVILYKKGPARQAVKTRGIVEKAAEKAKQEALDEVTASPSQPTPAATGASSPPSIPPVKAPGTTRPSPILPKGGKKKKSPSRG